MYMDNKKIKNLSEQIAGLEQELLLGKNVSENQDKINIIMSTLSLEEMLEVDDYITTNGLLNKNTII